MQSSFDNNRWIFWVFCHWCEQEYKDSFPPDSCDYCGSRDLSVSKDEGESTAKLAK